MSRTFLNRQAWPVRVVIYTVAIILFVLAPFEYLLMQKSLGAPSEIPLPASASINMGKSGWQEKLKRSVAENGFGLVQQAMKPDEIKTLRDLAVKYCYNSDQRLDFAGYVIPDFLSMPHFDGSRFLLNHKGIHSALEAVMGGTDYRFCKHNDIGCDRIIFWHKDKLNGAVKKYQTHDLWQRSDSGHEHEIYKVLIYLQDHRQDDYALKVVPSSHQNRKIQLSGNHYHQLRPNSGDIVIFDQRLTHTGQNELDLTKQRILVSLGFGKNNVFTDEFEKGTEVRQKMQVAKMAAQISGGGVLSTQMRAVQWHLQSALYRYVPPQLLADIAPLVYG